MVIQEPVVSSVGTSTEWSPEEQSPLLFIGNKFSESQPEKVCIDFRVIDYVNEYVTPWWKAFRVNLLDLNHTSGVVRPLFQYN